MQLLLHAIVNYMSRRYAAFRPPNPPPEYIDPANDQMFDFVEFDKLYLAPPTAAGDIAVDKASKQITYSADILLTPDDHFVGVDTSAESITITLPLSTAVDNGKQLVIKDEGNNASVYPIIITTAAADAATIDGHTTVQIMSNCGALSLYFNGSGWHIY
jgi:hypothetical protein